MAAAGTQPDLVDPSFVVELGQYPHERLVVDVDTVEDCSMVDLARFLDEFFYHGLFFLVLSVLHSYTGWQAL
jgi:hypothetical protein